MRLTIARGELFSMLSTVSKGLSSRSTLPILSGILFSATEDGSLTIQTTDLEVSVRTSSAAAVDSPGQVVLPGKLVTDIVRSLPEAAMSISIDGEIALVSCGQASFTLKTLNAADFPKFPEVSTQQTVSLDTAAMINAVSHVSRAVSRDETRPILTGVLLAVEGHTLRMVATDSYRLAVKEIILEEESPESIEVVVPGRALEEAVKLAAGSPKLSLGVSENQVVFSAGNTLFVSRRIEGSFPNYKQLIPKDIQTTATLKKEDLNQAVKRVSLMAQHNTPLKVALNAEDQTLSLSATTQDIGDASEDLMATVEGEAVEIAFNHGFLSDGIASTSAENMTLEVVSALKPGVLTSVEDEGFLYLLMPVRLG